MRYYGVTDKGLVRKSNQDNYIISTNKVGDVFAIVCDGIGGGRAGDVASKMAIDYFSEVFSKNTGFNDMEEIKTWVRFHISKCNEKIYIKSSTTNIYKGMGTTFTGMLISNVGKLVVNIGDSRVYGVNEFGFKQLTQDHTLVQDMLKHGEISEQEAINHPKRNILTNAMGVWSNVRVDIENYKEKLNDILICSDGLFGYVKEDLIEKVMLTDELTTTLKARKLLNLALKAGGYDNITIIIIELKDGDNR
ncbi:MAG: Stp1/IreP family PP2C-type Ser/Thr phosphatase [Erysipelotrichaceae bacterium]|nr:Stp1/IreP family PP2C-type Ser/Thr phosphatase [Erysipelotrichaceae bacterium]